MQKVDGVQDVRVRLNDGLTVLDLKPGNTVKLGRLRQIIRNNGFVPKEATVIASGAVTGAHAFVVSGTGEQLPLTTEARRTGEDWQLSVAATNVKE